MTPKPDLRKFKGWPDSHAHSAMEQWAKENAQPMLRIAVTFNDGSVWVEKFDPATKEVKYEAGGEVYTQSVDIANKWEFDKGEKGLTKAQCIAAQKAFCSAVKVISIEATLESKNAK